MKRLSDQRAKYPDKKPDALYKDLFVLPASYAQERLWFLDQLGAGSAYNICGAMRIKGSPDTDALKSSLNKLIQRHESLRTTFTVADGHPVQVIAEHGTVDITVTDLGLLPEEGREAEARRLAVEESQRPFDMTRGPLLTVHLFRLSEDDHILLITMHHIVSDGWSLGIFTRELTVLYEACRNNKPFPLPDLPVQYADFALWQRDWMKDAVLEKDLSYWRQQLEGLPVLQLPADRPRPAAQTFEGASIPLMFSKPLTESLKELSRSEGVTLFMTLFAAFNVLLNRYTGQEDVVVGTPIANRNRAEMEGLIGFFANSLVLRTDLSGNPRFRELLKRVREVTLGAYAHQDLPFEKLVEELQPERDLSQNPLFQVMYAFQNAKADTLELDGLSLYPMALDITTTRFDIEFHLWDKSDGLNGFLLYNPNLYDADRMNRMAGHYHVLLERLAADPGQRISIIPLMKSREREQLITEWNNTRADYSSDLHVHELFERQAEKTPQHTALIFEGKQLTYRELNRRSNQIAHHLQQLGVGPESIVGICMDRSFDMITGLLGVLKAGGACLPLDPDYPAERLAFMIRDADAPAVLTRKLLTDSLPVHNVDEISLDSDRESISRNSSKNAASGVNAENLAYVIYTSGSTGRPKGVAFPHGALLNLINWQIENSVLGTGAKTLQFTTLSFDVSFQEIFLTLCSGGTLVLVTGEIQKDAERLARFIADHAIERLFLPFIALHQLAETINAETMRSLRLKEVITAGEQLKTTTLIKQLFGQVEGSILTNQYGPSESHVVTALTLGNEPDSWTMLPPIGRPIANTQIYVLDRHLQPVPVGVPGELYIGGTGLCRGYVKRPALTSEKFIPDPFSNIPGARLYKTGDRARYLQDGNIQFLGRVDQQVKVRGFRIEPGEVEITLGHHPAVRESVVLSLEGTPGVHRLAAYIVPNETPAPSVSELRNFLSKKLPDYMVPSIFLFIDALPLTPSGKVDRRALPAPDGERPETESKYVAPRTHAEKVMAGIWSDLIGVKRVSIYDNFFELGGHSLLATQIISRLRDIFRIELPLNSLFQAPTVEGMISGISEMCGGRDVCEEIAHIQRIEGAPGRRRVNKTL